MELSKRTQFCQHLLFFKLCFSIRACYKELIWSTNYPKVHILVFQKHWSFIEGVLFLCVLKKLFPLQPLGMISMPIYVLRGQFCYSCMYTKSQLFKETPWVVKLLRCWSVCKSNDMQTLFSALCRHLLPRF